MGAKGGMPNEPSDPVSKQVVPVSKICKSWGHLSTKHGDNVVISTMAGEEMVRQWQQSVRRGRLRFRPSNMEAAIPDFSGLLARRMV